MSRFSEQAALYAQYRPGYPDSMYKHIFEHLSSFEAAWDCATGSGQVATYLADHFDEVIATDISEEQLSYAPQKKNIRYKQSAAEYSGLPSNFADLITVAQAIHWFNFDPFYDEVRRVAKDGALLAAIGYGMIRINSTLNPIVDDLYEEAFGTYFNENRKHIDERYQSIPFPLDEILAPSFNNHLTLSFDQLEGYFNSWSAIQKTKDEKGYNPVTETIEELKNKSSSSQIDVNFPVFMRLGRIQKSE